MKAMILAAGVGSRLRPLTDTLPKALVEVAGKPLLEWVILKLKRSGYNEIIINLHHFPEKIRTFIDQKEAFGIRIAFSEEMDQLLDSGGGIKKASWFFDDGQPFLVHNVDVISDIDLPEMRKAHLTGGAIATLAVRSRQTDRYFLFDNNDRLCGWENRRTGEKKGEGLHPYAFSGVHILSPDIFNMLPQSGRFSIIEAYLDIARIKPINAFVHDKGFWFDLGKAKDLKNLSEEITLKLKRDGILP